MHKLLRMLSFVARQIKLSSVGSGLGHAKFDAVFRASHGGRGRVRAVSRRPKASLTTLLSKRRGQRRFAKTALQ